MPAKHEENLLLKKERPQKKFKLKVRHHKVAKEFQLWLNKNPKASRKQRVKTFDAFCDSAYLSEEISKHAK